MSFRNVLGLFNEPIMDVLKGEQILERYVRPILKESDRFDKVSSFFTPHVLASIIQELGTIFQKGGAVRLVVGIHDGHKLLPVLSHLTSSNDLEMKYREAVAQLLHSNIEKYLEVVHDDYNNVIKVFSELVRQELVHIKIAAVKTDWNMYLKSGSWPEGDSTFHPKISIFNSSKDTIVLSGSVNTTLKGYGENVEHINLNGSWFAPNAVTKSVEIFEQIWSDSHADTKTLNFTEEVAAVIREVRANSEQFKRILNKAKVKNLFGINEIRNYCDLSPFQSYYSFTGVNLFPHQISVVREVLSRNPVRALVADEVGLGKTIEAGAIINHLLKFRNAERVAIAVPSSLRFQWQLELRNLFGLDFFIFNHSSKCLEKYNDLGDIVESFPVRNGDFYGGRVKNIIFSWHFLKRELPNGNYRLNASKNFDLLVVDEAHSARNHSDIDGDNPTQLYSFLDSLKDSVKHLILLTATPFQTKQDDYLSLLKIVLTQRYKIDGTSLERVADINRGIPLTTQRKIDAIKEFCGNNLFSVPSMKGLTAESDLPTLLRQYNNEFYLWNHPTTVFTFRNTRDNLKKIGYKFPTVNLESQAIILSPEQRMFYDEVFNYIENHLYSFERRINVLKSIGFVKVIYSQRVVSSFKACKDTLTSRKHYLQTVIDTGRIANTWVTSVSEIDDADLTENAIEELELERFQLEYAQNEIDYLDGIIGHYDYLDSKSGIDPKLARCIDLINEHYNKGESIIVFSKYTSTTTELLKLLLGKRFSNLGVFQGNRKSWINSGTEIELSRTEIASKFKDKEFRIMVCSDAASEGLNLQSANVLLNVDVPWNPARLLQRFGRIDRFGQKNEQIFFYNLFYPGSVEDRMYSRLHRRNNEFRFLLGATPDISDNAHIGMLLNQEFIELDNTEDFEYRNSLLTEFPDYIHATILNAIVDSSKYIVRDEDITNPDGTIYKYSKDLLDSDYLNIRHIILDELKMSSNSGERKQVFGIFLDEIFLCFAVKEDDLIFPIVDLEQLISCIIDSGRSYILNREFVISKDSLYLDFLESLKINFPQMINPVKLEMFIGEDIGYSTKLQVKDLGTWMPID